MATRILFFSSPYNVKTTSLPHTPNDLFDQIWRKDVHFSSLVQKFSTPTLQPPEKKRAKTYENGDNFTCERDINTEFCFEIRFRPFRYQKLKYRTHVCHGQKMGVTMATICQITL